MFKWMRSVMTNSQAPSRDVMWQACDEWLPIIYELEFNF